jgi:hypothetical protein
MKHAPPFLIAEHLPDSAHVEWRKSEAKTLGQARRIAHRTRTVKGSTVHVAKILHGSIVPISHRINGVWQATYTTPKQ